MNPFEHVGRIVGAIELSKTIPMRDNFAMGHKGKLLSDGSISMNIKPKCLNLGYRASYTGALDKKGLFEACDGETLFLDELHCMLIHLQAKLLRVIESRSARRIGENEEQKFDVRIIAATNINSNDILTQGYIRHAAIAAIIL